jgi:hypothetical protein
VTLTGWIFMVGLRVFDIGALVVWLVWFFRQRDDEDDEGGGGPGGGRGGGAGGPKPGPPLPDADPWPERRRDHLGDRPSATRPSRPHVTPEPARRRVRISGFD